MPDNLPTVLGNKRQRVNRLPQALDQVRDNRAVITKRAKMNVPHAVPITRTFGAKIHAWRVETSRAARTRFYGRNQTGTSNALPG